ncbi:gfo/Idh/MocA family oxidoreductase, partial [Streptomyces sp. SID14478]|nr:gfo/Idh/MocA family oxidoreductase [Streptomyces sp. SID14478]
MDEEDFRMAGSSTGSTARETGGGDTEGEVKPVLGVGMVGYAFMGAAHSQGWRTVGRAFDLPLTPRLAAVCGRDAGAVRAAA